VVGVSFEALDVDSDPDVCEFCGFPIEEEGQDCPTLDDGRCRT